MGQQHQFRPGQKAPNNGVYVEIGETGSMVKNPQKSSLQWEKCSLKLQTTTDCGRINENREHKKTC